MGLNLDKDPRYVSFRCELVQERARTVRFIPPLDWNTPQGLREVVRHQCTSFCPKFAKAFPELTCVKGFFGPFGTEHVWLKHTDGTIIDPTSEQFFKDDMPPPLTHYEPWPSDKFKMRIGACPNCGDDMYEGGEDFGGVCSEDCFIGYSSYLSGMIR